MVYTCYRGTYKWSIYDSERFGVKVGNGKKGVDQKKSLLKKNLLTLIMSLKEKFTRRDYNNQSWNLFLDSWDTYIFNILFFTWFFS
jgi:hypothetical protein